jgi:hypothetical protein
MRGTLAFIVDIKAGLPSPLQVRFSGRYDWNDGKESGETGNSKLEKFN